MRRISGLIAAVLLFVGLLAAPAHAEHPPEFFGNSPSPAPTIGISSTSSGSGYYTLDAVGGITTHGDATFFGSLPGLRSEDPNIGPAQAVDLSTTTSDDGYWVLDEFGGIFTFGDAEFFGSLPGLRDQGIDVGFADVLDLSPAGDDGGYYLLDEVGGVHTFGTAEFFGSLPGLRNAGVPVGPSPAIALLPLPGNDGYFLLDAIGGVHTFGDAEFEGSLPGRGVDARAVGMAITSDGRGYWILDELGGVHAFGTASFFGAPSGIAGTPVGIAASPHDTGYWVAFDTGQVVAFPGGETESLTSQTFSGTGDTAVGPFELEGGLVINTYSHDGESNFIVELLDDNGDTEDLVINEIGSLEGASATSVDPGSYRLDVTADGEWSINVDEPRPTSGESLPFARSSDGNTVIGALQGTGTEKFTWSHGGESNFIVELLDENGETVDLLVNEIGETEGSTFGDFDGIRYLEITADGNWDASAG